MLVRFCKLLIVLVGMNFLPLLYCYIDNFDFKINIEDISGRNGNSGMKFPIFNAYFRYLFVHCVFCILSNFSASILS